MATGSPGKKKYLHYLWIPATVVVLAFLAVFALPISPFSPLHVCTLIGCRDSLEISLSREPSAEYTVVVTASDGEIRSITCSREGVSASTPIEETCYTGVVTFYGFTPSQVTVEISWLGGNHSSLGNPIYSSFQPNGRLCPPTCQSGKLQIPIP